MGSRHIGLESGAVRPNLSASSQMWDFYHQKQQHSRRRTKHSWQSSNFLLFSLNISIWVHSIWNARLWKPASTKDLNTCHLRTAALSHRSHVQEILFTLHDDCSVTGSHGNTIICAHVTPGDYNNRGNDLASSWQWFKHYGQIRLGRLLQRRHHIAGHGWVSRPLTKSRRRKQK